MTDYKSHIEDCSNLITVKSEGQAPVFCLMAVSLTGLDDHLDDYAQAILTASEQQKYKRLTFTKRRREWFGGRLACKEAVARLLTRAVDLKDIAVSNTEHGRPLVTGKGCENIHVSISHSGDIAMALASFKPCGLDVQSVVGTLERVHGKFITTEEKNVLTGCEGTQLEQLGVGWAIKEALRKQVDLWPLLGFLEMRLEDVETCDDGYVARCWPVKKERLLPACVPVVYATLYKGKALAFCFDA